MPEALEVFLDLPGRDRTRYDGGDERMRERKLQGCSSERRAVALTDGLHTPRLFQNFFRGRGVVPSSESVKVRP